jgi:hypothetical protein
MAQKAYERLNSAQDTDFAYVFERTFNVRKDDQTTYGHIKSDVDLESKTIPDTGDIDSQRSGKAVDLVKSECVLLQGS